MGAAVNGLALHGGIVKPYCSTFFVFTDYMRPPIRLSALMKLDAVWIFSHDSVAVGEDGPTHQPVEHLAAMRAIPNLTVIRPADANETAEAWAAIIEELHGPICLVLSRQNVPTLDRSVFAAASGLRRGAYVLAAEASPAAVLVATGAEVSTAVAARELLAEKDVAVSVVSMPSWELFDAQDASYRAHVLPADVPKFSVEAGASFGWSRWVDYSVAIDTFGASGPGGKVLEHFGISPQAVAARVEEVVA
jgi:transketolase